ncbi:MAG: TonB-dependent receptor, partial [Ferruginibacter sp.]
MALLFITVAAFAQHVVKGKVVDRNGSPIAGASVKQKGSSSGTVTDKDGNYSLKVSAKVVVLVFSGTGLTGQEVSANSNFVDITLIPSVVNIGSVEVVGTRSLKRSATETALPIDIIPISKITNSIGQVDLNQILQYVAPSFNSNRQSGADGADHVDPASLRGLGPDQTLVLVNGKRWHQSALVNLFGSRGRGNTGTDLNAIPAAAIERIEILRDGAAAQYGSDAIAGVVNIILKSATKEGTANVSAGTFMTGHGASLNSPAGKILDKTTDGLTLNASVNYGFELKNKGFFNVTADYMNKAKTYRPNFETLYPDNYRRKAGDGGIENYSLFFNSAIPLKGNTNFYAFGGVGQRNGSAYAYTRSADDDRNVQAIYPDGFDPLIKSNVSDISASFGIKSKFCGWNADFNATLGSNRFQYRLENTLNASLGANSPTKFNAGGFKLSQNTFGIHINKAFNKVAKGANVALGTELRQDQYRIFAGELNSYKQFPTPGDVPGGSQGFPGFQPGDEANKQRINWGAYADGELDVTKSFLVN